MSTNTLATNIGQTIHDLNEIKEAIIEKGVAVPAGTKTSDFDDLIRSIQTGGGDISEYLQAAISTVSVTNNGPGIGNQCEAFTKQIVSYDGMWQGNTKIESIDASFEKLVSGVDMFNNNIAVTAVHSIRNVKTNLNSLVDGTRMFSCQYMFTFEVEGNQLPQLVNGDSMFYYNTESSSFGVNMPKLENGNVMFCLNGTMQSFSSEMPNLKYGRSMFDGCSSLVNFTSGLPSLEDGTNMFNGCDRLSVGSLQNIITTLPDRSQTTNATLTIGSVNIGKLDLSYTELAASKNWTLN